MSKSNPFMLSSGRIPPLYIDRLLQKNQIIDDFSADIPSNKIYMLTGIRGSGKTVMMTDIEKSLEKTGDFIVLNLSIDGKLVEEWASGLYEHPLMKPSFIKLKFDFSVLGIGVSIEKSDPVTDISAAIGKMLDVVKKMGKKVLIAIDEAVNNAEMKRFGSLFSIYLRTEYPVFLIMTGLPQNIYSVINAKTLTFLTRAPKIVLDPINYTMIRKTYEDVFELEREESEKMTFLTKGYSFGFQLLGYLLWEKRTKLPKAGVDDILTEYDARLAEGAYDKVWQDLSDADRAVCRAIAETDGSVAQVRVKLKCTPQKITNYKQRLKDRGIIIASNYASMEFCLPRFKEYVLNAI